MGWGKKKSPAAWSPQRQRNLRTNTMAVSCFDRGRNASSRVKECAVCQESLIEEVAVVPCGHSFHPE